MLMSKFKWSKKIIPLNIKKHKTFLKAASKTGLTRSAGIIAGTRQTSLEQSLADGA
jgi:hypothetical protein